MGGGLGKTGTSGEEEISNLHKKMTGNGDTIRIMICHTAAKWMPGLNDHRGERHVSMEQKSPPEVL